MAALTPHDGGHEPPQAVVGTGSDEAIERRPTGLKGSAILDILDPLDAEQGLHLLDALTWFPHDEGDRFLEIAAYVRPGQSPRRDDPHPAEVYCGALERVLAFTVSPGDDFDLSGRWALVRPHRRSTNSGAT